MTTLELWNKCQLLSWGKPEVDRWISIIEKNKYHYIPLAEKTGVPYWQIGFHHGRESDFDFGTYLHNGDPLNKPTHNVPKGLGPFLGIDGKPSWELSALDALNREHLKDFDLTKIEGCLDFAEHFNGMGYRKMGLRSNYVWGLTDMQQPGKYIRDHVFDATIVNKRPGVASIALHFVPRTTIAVNSSETITTTVV